MYIFIETLLRSKPPKRFIITLHIVKFEDNLDIKYHTGMVTLIFTHFEM